MPTLLAIYYREELNGWSEHIDFYNDEIEGMGKRLSEIVQRNTIPDIATKVENEQDKINRVADRFLQLSFMINDQLEKLKANNLPVEEVLIDNEMEKKQSEIRQSMHIAEKEFVDVKYAYTDFVLSTLKQVK